jgi:hypothetical protein
MLMDPGYPTLDERPGPDDRLDRRGSASSTSQPAIRQFSVQAIHQASRRGKIVLYPLPSRPKQLVPEPMLIPNSVSLLSSPRQHYRRPSPDSSSRYGLSRTRLDIRHGSTMGRDMNWRLYLGCGAVLSLGGSGAERVKGVRRTERQRRMNWC